MNDGGVEEKTVAGYIIEAIAKVESIEERPLRIAKAIELLFLLTYLRFMYGVLPTKLERLIRWMINGEEAKR